VSQWEYKVSKVKLAEVLWPTLLQKIRLSMTTKGASIPPIAAVINDAYHVALRWRYQSYVLTETPPESRLGVFVTFRTSALRARRTLNRRLQLCFRVFGEVFASLLVI
jgi:hypothetical protein